MFHKFINDTLDYEQDRLHPTKRNRPIAAGHVKRSTAAALSVVLVVAGLTVGWRLNIDTVTVLAVYYVTNLAYSTKLKHVALVDVFIIAFGFLLRVVAGATAIGAPISAWLLVTSFFLALFMAFGKRRGELDTLGEHGVRLGEGRANEPDDGQGEAWPDSAAQGVTA